MPQRKNNSGKPSRPYKKQDDRKSGSGYKKSEGPSFKRNSEDKKDSYKSKPKYNNDPNELAPPRFLAPKEQKGPFKKTGPDGRKPEARKYGESGGKGRGPERDSRGNRPEGSKPYKGTRDGGNFNKPPYKKSTSDDGREPYKGKSDGGNYSKTPYKKSTSDDGREPYKGTRDGGNYSKAPYKKSASNDGREPFKKRDTYSSDSGYRKPSSDRPFSDADGRKPYKKREDHGGSRDSGRPSFKRNASDDNSRPAYKGRGKDEGGFKKPGFQKRGPETSDKTPFKSGPDKDKPFRPKYDPEVKLKKSYTERKKELLGVKDDPEDIRLNKYIANSGICSRREADELISHGLVSINGTVVTEMGYRVKKTDLVRYDGRKILPEPFVYILMNKPKDFITTTDDEKGRKTVMDLLADKIPQRVYPIGRLDRNTTGVLLLTNDGEVAQALTHPSFQIKKVYHAVLDKKVNGSDLDKLVEGVELEDGVVHADAVAFVDNEDKRHVGVEIHSGKNRVVRRMFEHLGYEVEKLDRVSMGIFTKKDLPRGKWRFLKESEIGFLMKLKAKMP